MKIKKINTSGVIIGTLLTVWGLVILYPFYNAFLTSVVPQKVTMRSPFLLYPKEFTLASYEYVLKWRSMLTGLANTCFVLVTGVIYNLTLTLFTAYALTKPIPGRKFFTMYILFTMFFSGGLLPYYLLVGNLGLTNSLWAMVLPAGINIFNMLLMQSYFRTLAPEFEESAKIDGASELAILFRIIIPLCKPMLATITLYYAVDRWNEWYAGMLFMRTSDKWPLQLFIRNMLLQADLVTKGIPPSQRANVFPTGIQMAAVIVTMLPIVCVYPFLQKYFVKGITLGGVKG